MLKRSADRKVTPLVRITEKSWTVKSKNSFGLPAGKKFSCPGATSVCENICYASKIEKLFPNSRNLLLHNWNLLKDANTVRMALLLDNMIQEFRRESEKMGSEKIFRIHWDGDFFSESYAVAWADVIENNPDVHFWVYTRSFVDSLNVIPIIAGIDNLSVYLSADSDNYETAKDVANEYNINIAILGETATEAKEMVNSVSCPENVDGKLSLFVNNGNGYGEGACSFCGLCVNGRRNVAFSISGKE